MTSFIVDQEAVAAQLMTQLRRADVEPILARLADMLSCPPDVEALQEWSNRYPEKWAAAVTTLARLGGFHEKRELNIGVTMDLSRLSDSQLAERIKSEMAKLAGPALELTAEEAVIEEAANDLLSAGPPRGMG